MYDNILTVARPMMMFSGAGWVMTSSAAAPATIGLSGGPGADCSGRAAPAWTSPATPTRCAACYVDLSTSFSSGDPDDAPVRGGDAEGDYADGHRVDLGLELQADKLIGSHAANYLFGNGGNDEP